MAHALKCLGLIARRCLTMAGVLALCGACSDRGDGRGFLGGQAGVAPPCPTTGIDCPKPQPSYNDVQQVLDQRCTGCHSPDGEASDRLLTSRAAFDKISSTVGSYVLACHMPPPPLPLLTADERATLLGFIACQSQ